MYLIGDGFLWGTVPIVLMNYLYIKKGKETKKSGRLMLLDLAYDFAEKEGIPTASIKQAKILEEPEGRPYLNVDDIEFSVSHSGDYWAALFSKDRCGLDIQIERTVAFTKIAKRFFTEREAEYVDLFKAQAFYDIWTKKEAYGKMTGKGFFSNPPSFVDDSMNEVTCIDYKSREFFVFNTSIEELEGYKLGICAVDKEYKAVFI